MSALDTLTAEHRLIEFAIDSMQALLEKAGTSQRLSARPFLEFEAFILRYADGAHHIKEELVLFEELGKKGLSLDTGPVGRMLEEHEAGRNLRLVLGRTARACAEGDFDGYADMLHSASTYGDLLKTHIQKEDQILYPMALRLLSPEVLSQLPTRFRASDATTLLAFENAVHRIEVVAAREWEKCSSAGAFSQAGAM